MVTFLYKLAPGPCPKSFGINVARLAQLPNAVSEGVITIFCTFSSKSFLYSGVDGKISIQQQNPCPRQHEIKIETCYYLRTWPIPYAPQVISAAKRKSEEFERALSHQHAAVAGDEKGRLALAMLALLGGGENESEAVRAGEQLRSIWEEAQK